MHGVVDAYDIDVDAIDERKSLHIPSSRRIGIRSSLPVDLAVICKKCDKYLVDDPSAVADIF